MVLESNTLEFLFLKDGEKGEPGVKGNDGKTLYTWIKYSQNADGSNMTDDPTDAIYIGLSYNNESATESNNPSDYNWTKIKGNDGEQGTDAYTILLTNENISFATDVNRKPLSNQSHTCEVIVLKGTEIRTDFTIGTITSVAGISTSVSNRVITLSSTTSTAITSDSGKISIPIIVDGTLFTKIITFSVSKQGVQGESGLDAKSLDLYSSTYAVAFDSNGNLKDSSDIILTANQQNFTDTITWSTIPSVALGTVSGNANQRTLLPSLFNNNNQIQVIVTSDDLSDTITIVKVQDGIKGEDGTSVTIKGSYTLDEWNNIKDSLMQSASPGDGYIVDGDLYTFDGTTFVNCGQIKGDKGDAGDDAYTIILSNESHTFAGNTTSAIAASTKCEVIAYKGTVQMSVTIGTISGLPAGMTAPISNNGKNNAYFSPTVTTSMTTKSGTLTIPITVDGKTFTKYFSYSLALQGAQGSNGISVSSVVVQYYQSTSATELIGGSWSPDRPTWVDGKYIWSKQVTTLSNGDSSETEPVCITGGTGNNGADGRSIEDIVTEFYLSTSKTALIGGSWSEIQPEWSSGHYVWTRSKIMYDNPTSTEYTTPICDTTWEAIQSQIDIITETMSGVEQKVDANTKSITDKVWQADITEKIDNYDNTTTKILRDKVSKNETDINGIRSEVSDVKTTVEHKADGSTVMELQRTVSENKQDVDGFKQTVSKTYATKDSLNDYSTTEQVQSAIEQKADAILGTITDDDGNSTTYQGTLAGLATQVKDAEGNITQLQQTSQEITLKVGNAEKLALESKVLSVNLSVETMTVATDVNGNNGSYSNCKTIVSIFYGIENVTTNSTITCTPSSGVTGSWNSSTKVYSISNMTVDNGTVEIKATYKVTIDGKEQTLTNTKTFSVSKSKQGTSGGKGDKGAQGVSVKSVTPEYYLSTSSTSVTGGSWVAIPPIKTNSTYIWKREHITYDNNTESYSSAVLDQSLNELFQSTSELKVEQNKIKTKVSDNEGNISEIKQKAGSIEAEIKDAKGSSSSLKARLEGIETTVVNKEKNLQSQITQNSGKIELTASKTEEVKTDLANNYYTKTQTDAAIKVQSDRITSTVSKVETVEKNAVTSSVEQFYLSTSPTSLAGGSWSTTQPTWTQGKYIWRRTLVTKGDGTTSYTPSATGVCITGNTGATGATGATGTAGKGIKSTAVTYQASTSGTTAPTGTWSSTIPSVSANRYLWTRTIITYTDNTTSTSYSVGKMGATGATGNTGNGIKSTAITYQASTSGTTVPTGTWSTSIPSVSAGSFLWTRTIITYTDNTTSTSYSVSKMGNTGATGMPGIDFSQGKMLYGDPMFASGVNGTTKYANSGGDYLTWSRVAKSSDNPMTGTKYEMVCTNTGTVSPANGGFKWNHASRANAVFIYRIIAKIPSGRALMWASNSTGTGGNSKWLTSNAGTGKFTEYLYRMECGGTGTFSSTGYFYVNGSAGSSSSPFKWYVAYATVFDMTNVSDVRTAQDTADNAQTTAGEANATADATEARVTVAESKIKQLYNQISMLIRDEKGNSMLTQTSTGWAFDMSTIINTLNSTTGQLNTMVGNVAETKNAITNLNSLANDLAKKTAYITITQDSSGQPCIELGQSDNMFKVRITNTAIEFWDGSSKIAYISNQALYIEKAIIRDELLIGDESGFIWKKRTNGNMGVRWKGV